nr:transposase family protein [Candidatus Freyarchaeota archaeon]
MVRKSEPNACWDIDFCEFYSENLHETVYRIEIVDDCTNARLSTTLALEESSEAATKAVRQAIKCFGVPEEIHSDNGLQFRAARADRPSEQFARLAEEFGIAFSYSTEGRPNENGKAEHACRDFKVEFLSDDQLFALVSEDPLHQGQHLLSLYNIFHNWLPSQGHHLYGASPAQLHPRASVTKQEALEAFEELYLKPKGMSFNTSDWQILQGNI